MANKIVYFPLPFTPIINIFQNLIKYFTKKLCDITDKLVEFEL